MTYQGTFGFDCCGGIATIHRHAYLMATEMSSEEE